MYQKILAEAMAELKEDEFKELFKDEKKAPAVETQVETDLELHIPDYYVSSIHERLALYNRLNDLKDESELLQFRENLKDRFGSIPKATRELLDVVRLKWLLEDIFVDKATLKRGRMKAIFLKKVDPGFFQKEAFGNLLLYVQKHPQKAKLTQETGELTLIVNEVGSARQAVATLREMLGIVVDKAEE